MKDISMSFNFIKKGAMFGLDARIALAIFGALSVISGAALYSAIKEAKITAIITEYNEAAKAYESYILDTGEDISVEANGYDVLATNLVVKPSVLGWNGPYWSAGLASNNDLNFNSYSDTSIFFVRADDSQWHVDGYPDTSNVCDGSKPCYNWITLNSTNNDRLNLFAELDKRFDNSDGVRDGSVRHYNAGGIHSYIRIKFMPSISNN
jgi:type II secretory pathway pseudopilin PulG